MKSKVVEIKSVKERDSQYGKTFFFNCKMENGDIISIGKKNKDAIQLNTEINYEITEGPNEYGVCKVKEIKEEFKKTGFAKDYNKDSVSMALSYAKDLVVGGKVELRNIYEVADKLHLWMTNKYKGETKVEVPVSPKKEIEVEIPF